MKTKTLFINFNGGGTKGLYPCYLFDMVDTVIRNQHSMGLIELFKMKYDYIIISGTSVGSLIGGYLYNIISDDGRRSKHINFNRLIDLHFSKIFSQQYILPLMIRGKFKNNMLRKIIDEFCVPYVDTIKSNLNKGDSRFRCKEVHLIVPSYCVEYGDFIIKSTMDNDLEKAKISNIIEWNTQILASCSAPTFFKPVQVYDQFSRKVNLIDGGMILNNPSMLSLVEANRFLKVMQDDENSIDVISLGVSVRNKQRYKNLFHLIQTMTKTTTDTQVEEYYMKSLSDKFKVNFFNFVSVTTRTFSMSDLSLDFRTHMKILAHGNVHNFISKVLN